MNKEIKEILDRLKDSVTNSIIYIPVMGGVSEPIDNSQCLEPNECKILLDYITDLQEENVNLKGEVFNLKAELIQTKGDLKLVETNSMNTYIDYLYEEWEVDEIVEMVEEELESRKNKIDKAIKYIEEHTDKLKTARIPKIEFNYNYLLNILQGKDNE